VCTAAARSARGPRRSIVQATAQARIEISPSNEKEFFAKVVDVQITFVTDEKTGRAAALILHQGGRDQRAERVEGAAAALAPKEHKEVHLDPEILARYVGTYRFASGFTIAAELVPNRPSSAKKPDVGAI
jgi:hypothetical protein